MLGRFNLGTGGSKIDGLIKEYTVASGGNISKGSFIKFVNRYTETDRISEDLSNIENSVQHPPLAVELQSNKVLVLFNDNNGSNGANFYLRGVVCSITEVGINIGTDTQLSAELGSGYRKTAVLITDNKVLIAYGNNYKLQGIICTVEGLNIIVGTPTTIYSCANTSYNIYEMSAVSLESNKVFLVFGYGSSSSMTVGGTICTINANEIATGSIKSLLTASNTVSNILTIKLQENNVLISYISNSKAYCAICSVNNNAITRENTLLITDKCSKLAFIKFSENKVFISYIDSSFSLLKAFICTINGTEMSLSASVQLSTKFANSISMFKNSLNTIFIAFGGQKYESGTNPYKTHISKLICTIDSTDIIVSDEEYIFNVSRPNNYFGVTELVCTYIDNKVLIIHGCNSNRNSTGLLLGTFYNGVHQLESNDDKILGISKTSGVSGEKIKVYVPNIEEEMV